MLLKNRSNSLTFFIFLLVSLTFYSCSKDNNPVDSTQTNFSGLWSGTIASNVISTPSALTLNITQTNNNVSGNYNVVTGAYGTVSGTINGSSINFTLTQTTPTCRGSFSGQGTFSNNTLTFTFSGSDCLGAYSGSGNVAKYNSSGDVICPLYVGAVWTYIDSTFSATGAFTSRDSSRLAIIGKNNFNYQGQSLEMFYWNWINIQTGKPQTYSWLMRNENDGLNVYGGFFRNQPSTLIKTLGNKFPVNAGDTWNYPRWTFSAKDSSFSISDTSKYTCLAVDQVFKTAAGNFSCYVYTYQRKYTSSGQAMTDDNYLYYVKNKGYVGMVVKTNGVQRYKKSLKY